MKKFFLRVLMAFLFVGASAGLIIYFFFPQVLLSFVQWQYEQASGVIEKSAQVDGYNVTYYEGGKGEPLVLIHGFGDRKLSFVQTVRWLTPHFRVILPEVPGFGNTAHDPGRIYSIRGQVDFFHKFFKKLGLKSFALGGNSMGGHISVAYALHHPKQVKRLLLLDATGLHVKSIPPPYKDPASSIQNREDFHKYMKKVFYKIPAIPRSFEEFLIKRMGADFVWQNRVRSDIRRGKDYILNEKLSGIKMPTLLLWGDSDQIVLPAIGHAFRKEIPHATWVTMKHCGHSPQYERPRETAEIVLRFLQKKSQPAEKR